MRQWWVLYSKEMKEFARTSKWIWVPIVFVLMGITQPVTSYYMPQILQMAGNLPAGTVIEIPPPQAGEVLAQTLSQFGLIGLLILVLSSMSTLTGEKQKGVLSLIMVRQVPAASYLSSKLAAYATLITAAFALGYGASWYYTELLIGQQPLQEVIQSFLLYWLWFVFVLTLTILLGVCLKQSAGVAAISLLIATLLSIGSQLVSKYMQWSPGMLTTHAHVLLVQGDWSQVGWSIGGTLLMIGLALAAAVILFQYKEKVPS
ncbi:putative transmembrane protein YxlG [compost metagenome]